MLFNDYEETKAVYHVVTLTDLDETLKNGIKYNDKATYKSKYQEFHNYIDRTKPIQIPDWVIRSKAIFASINFKDGHIWHSHSAILKVRIKEERCWVCNENIANFLYEPLMLSKSGGFEEAEAFIKRNGEQIVRDYWNSSISFKENLKSRTDKKKGYDAEVLILHDIPPEDIELLYITSDHRYMSSEQWIEFFKSDNLCYVNC